MSIAIGGIVAVIGALLVYITRLDLISKGHFTGNLSNGLLLGLIFAIFGYSLLREKQFAAKSTTIFNSFVEGAYNGLAVGRIIFPYILGMLVAISLFRNSGLFDIFAGALARTFRAVHVNDQIVNALPIAILRPFSSAGSRGIPARRDGHVRRGLFHRSPCLRLSMRSGNDVLRYRRLLRECENQEYPIRAQHDVARRPDLRVCGDFHLPGVFPIADGDSGLALK